MMDSTMTNRPQLSWVEIPTTDGGSRLEMRWDTPALEANAPTGATTHAA